MASRRNADFSIPVARPQYSAGGAKPASKPQFHSAFLEKVHNYVNAADNRISEVGAPLKPYLPLVGRILVVITFLEDTLRIVTNWGIQVRYIWQVKGVPWILTEIFFVLNVVFMLLGSFSVVTKKRLLYGVGSLVGVLCSQAIVYGIFDIQFFARNVSLIGGLFLVLSDVFAREKRRLPGLPEMDSKDQSQTFILAGRILIVVLFASHLIRTKWTLSAILLNILSVSSCALLVVGYKARISASLLALLLLLQNFMTNSYWKLGAWNPVRDHKRHEHFQVLSIVGGLILLVNLGAGRLSFDEKRKIY